MDGGDGAVGGASSSLRANHEVVMSSARVDLEVSLGTGSGSRVVPPCGSIQLCHVCWERKDEVEVEKVEEEEGLKTSREPRESLGNGGMREGGVVSGSSSIIISLHEYQITKEKINK